MIETKAIFRGKEPNMDTLDCVITKVIRLPGAAFDSFSTNLLHDQDFIAENNKLMGYSDDGKRQCILVVGEGHKDGILVHSAGYDYARYTALIPNVEAFLLAEQYPALTEFNKKLANIVDYIVSLESSTEYTIEDGRSESSQIRYAVDLQDLDTKFDIDLMYNNAVLNTVLDMLESKPGIKGFELDKSELIIYRESDSDILTLEPLSDPTVTLTDMYAYGYAWDGMVPLGKERALELYDKGHEVYRLYEDNTEGAIGSREDILESDGLFGVHDPERKLLDEMGQSQLFQVFILNREKYDKGEAAGEWLTLPTDADTLQGLLERIGIEKPSEGAYTVTAVRMPMEDYLRDYISKYDSIDELNMLASFMNDMEDFERDKLQAILSSGVAYVASDASALINLLYEDKPKMSAKYDGVIPDEYKIVGKALAGMRLKAQERSSKNRTQGGRDGEKPSVMDEIKASRVGGKAESTKDDTLITGKRTDRQTTTEPKANVKQTPKKHKGGHNL